MHQTCKKKTTIFVHLMTPSILPTILMISCLPDQQAVSWRRSPLGVQQLKLYKRSNRINQLLVCHYFIFSFIAFLVASFCFRCINFLHRYPVTCGGVCIAADGAAAASRQEAVADLLGLFQKLQILLSIVFRQLRLRQMILHQVEHITCVV